MVIANQKSVSWLVHRRNQVKCPRNCCARKLRRCDTNVCFGSVAACRYNWLNSIASNRICGTVTTGSQIAVRFPIFDQSSPISV